MAAAAPKEDAAAGARALGLLEARPPNAEALGSLTALDLRGLGLGIVPDTLALCGRLVRLDLGGNPLTSFPEAVSQLTQLEVLFASDVCMTEVPNCLAACKKLRMLGLKDNKLESLPAGHLPEDLAWLIAAGNPIRELPDVGRLQRVRKLMLSHNQLTAGALAPVAGIQGLEMLRVAANRLEAFPKALLQHPVLAWVAIGGNPFAEAALERRLASAPATIDFADVSVGDRLGSGAGATVYEGGWQGRHVAVKIWDAERFSDGTALGEWGANRVAASPGHPALVAVLGAFEQPRPGMVLDLLRGAVAAAGPPTFATVTRDHLPRDGGRGPRLTVVAAKKVAAAVASATAYLHERGLIHGDIYLHNTLVVPEPAPGVSTDSGLASPCANGSVGVQDVRLSDFGAAAAVPDGEDGLGLQRLEVRSFGWLLQDLLDILDEQPCAGAYSARDQEALALLRALREQCAHRHPERLPTFADIAAALAPQGVPLGAL